VGHLAGRVAPPWPCPRDGHLLRDRFIQLAFSHEELNINVGQTIVNVRHTMEEYRKNRVDEQSQECSYSICKENYREKPMGFQW
jgi:hypothetical protein